MAQSRINKAASIFTRLDGLVKSKLIPWNERPLWYDVFRAFPPHRDPAFRTILGNEEPPKLPPRIFYKEDELRAYFFENLHSNEPIVLNSTLTKPVWENFIATYNQLKKEGKTPEDELIQKAMDANGIISKKDKNK